jgi:hypothetical protein
MPDPAEQFAMDNANHDALGVQKENAASDAMNFGDGTIEQDGEG